MNARISAKNRHAAAWTQVLSGTFFLLAAFLLLCARNDLLAQANWITLLPLSASSSILLLGGRFSVRGAKDARDRGTLLWAIALTTLFFCMLSAEEFLKSPLLTDAVLLNKTGAALAVRRAYLLWNRTGYPAACIGATFISVLWVLRFFIAGPRGPAAPETGRGAEPLRIYPGGPYRAALPLAAVSLICVLSAYPSMNIGDAPTIWYFARSGIWDEWHTIGYLAFIRALYAILPSRLFINLVQAAAWVFVNNYALRVLYKNGLGGRACRLYIATAILTFVPTFFVMVMIKDVVFSMELLLFGLCVLWIVSADQVKKRDWALLGVSGFFVSVLRHAGFLPVLVTLPVLFFRQLRIRRGALGAVVAAGIALTGFLALNLWFRALPDERHNPYYIAYSIPMQMIGAVAKSGVDILPEDRAVMEMVMPVERWAECYQHYHSDSVSRTYGKIGEDVEKVSKNRLGKALLLLNARFLAQFPKVYLEAFFDQNSLMWEMTTPADGYDRSYLWYPAANSSEDVPEDTVFNGFTALSNRYAEFLYGMPVLHSVLWRGGFANFALVLCCVVLIKKKRAADLIAILPVFVVSAGMLFSMPAQEVRYVFPNLEYAAFFTVYSYYAKRQEGHV